MTVSGERVEWRDKENLLGKMEGIIREILSTTIDKDMDG